MSTGQEKVNIFLKKFLTQQHITTNFLDYLHNLILEDHVALVGVNGVYSYPITGLSTLPDSITVLTPGETTPGDLNGPLAKMDDGLGHTMGLTTLQRTNIAVPNELGVKYNVGTKFCWLPSSTEINVRTGLIMWSLNAEAVGELNKPNAVSYHNNIFTLQVDNICSDMHQYGRKAKVYLETPVSQSSGDLSEEVIVVPHSMAVEKNGELGYIDIPTGQIQFFVLGKQYTIDTATPNPTVFTVTAIGEVNSGGTGYTRVSVDQDLRAYLVVDEPFITTGYNVVHLSGTLGQSLTPSLDPLDYNIYMGGVTVTSNNLQNDKNYVYLFSYIGTGVGNMPAQFNWVFQQQLPENVMQMLLNLKRWQEYVKQRDGFILRGGGQFTFAGGTLDWNDDFYIVNPYRGAYKIPASTITSIINDDVLYVKLPNEQDVIVDGTVVGEIWVKDNSRFNLEDTVLVGDVNSPRIPGVVKEVGAAGKLYLEDGLGNPLDLSMFLATTGSWVQPTLLELLKEQVNTGDLRPSGQRVIDEEVIVIAMAHSNSLIFKNGVLVLEDGDTGEIGNLPSGVNWVSNITELRNSVINTSDDNVALISPKVYSIATDLAVNKNLTWAGLSDRVIVEIAEAIQLSVKWDATTSSIHQNTEFKNIRFVGLGSGASILIDNTGATKPILVNFTDCVFTNLQISVTKGATTQPVILKFSGCRDIESNCNMVFPATHADDLLDLKEFKFDPQSGCYIHFGAPSTNPGAKASLEEVSGIEYFEALSSGRSNTVELRNCKGTLLGLSRIEILNPEQAIFLETSTDVDLSDEKQYLKHSAMTRLHGGGLLDYRGGAFSWSEDFSIIDPIYGVSKLTAGSLSGMVAGSILYAKFYRPQRLWSSGTVDGKAYVKETSQFNQDDSVLVGDHDSRVSGFILSAPVEDKLVVVDDGSGNVLDLSQYLLMGGSWIKRLNTVLVVGTIGVGDLARDADGLFSDDIFIVGVVDSKGIRLTNGVLVERWWIYEESLLSTGLTYGSAVTLPLDSKNGNSVKQYQNGAGHLQVEENGVVLNSSPVDVCGGLFDPLSYNGSTGFVSLADGVDMSAVLHQDTFVDATGTEFEILGGLSDVDGSKGFKIGLALTPDLGSGASIVRKQYEEDGAEYSWQSSITLKKRVPAGSVLRFRILPKGNAGRTVDA